MSKKNPIQLVLLGAEAATFAFSGAVMFVLISRVAGPELLGQYSLAFAWILIFQSVGNFGIPEFLMREIGRLHEEEGRLVGNGLTLGLLTSLAAIPLMLGAVHLSGYEPELKQALSIGAFVLVPAMATLICRGAFMVHKRTELITMVAVLEAAIVLSLNVYLVVQGHGIAALIRTVLIGKCVSCATSLLLYHRNIAPWKLQFDLRFCRTLLPPICTFAASNVLGLLSTRISIIMLSWWGDLRVVGIYAAANKLVEFTLMLPSIFSQFMLPQVARRFAETSRYDLRPHAESFYLLFAPAIALGLGLIYFADDVILLLFGPSFNDSTVVFRILLIFFLIESLDTVLGMVLKAAGRQKQDVMLYSSNLVLNVIANVLLIPIFGAAGAALARVVGAFASCILRYVYIARQLIRFDWFGLMLRPLVICLLLVAGGFALRDYAHHIVLGTVYVMSSAALLFFTASTQKELPAGSLSRDQ